MFELIGPQEKFLEAALNAGFDWLTEDLIPESDEPDDWDEIDDGLDDPNLTLGRLYLTMPSIPGLKLLLAMWERYSSGARESTANEKLWWGIFGYLSDVRVWGVKDRIEPLTQQFINRQLSKNPTQPVRVELDLWFRKNEILRTQALDILKGVVQEIGGRIIDFVTIEPIRYQAALVEIPGARARELENRVGPLAQSDVLVSIKPQSVCSIAKDDEEGEPEDNFEIDGDPTTLRPSVAAMLDGYPLQNHKLLAGRIDVEEIDVTAEMVPVQRRLHGTAIASLIIHGDLAEEQSPINRMLTAVPVLSVNEQGHGEKTPSDFLPLGLIYRSVTALVSEHGGEPALAPDVFIINHSICDAEGPFIRKPSSWARLLDFLSHRYRLLFIVSAGNIDAVFPVPQYASMAEFNDADPIQRQIALLRSIEAAKGTRGILSPAEAISAVTVGAVHADAAGDCPAPHIDPFAQVGLNNICSAVGFGINRAIKPDIVEQGGRQLVQQDITKPGVSLYGKEYFKIGQHAARARHIFR